jgi:hypothetical protein
MYIIVVPYHFGRESEFLAPLFTHFFGNIYIYTGKLIFIVFVFFLVMEGIRIRNNIMVLSVYNPTYYVRK